MVYRGETGYNVNFQFARHGDFFFLATEQPQKKCWRFIKLSDMTTYVLPVAKTYLVNAVHAGLLLIPPEFRKVTTPLAPSFNSNKRNESHLPPEATWQQFDIPFVLEIYLEESSVIWNIDVAGNARAALPGKLETVFDGLIKLRMMSIISSLRT